MKPEEREAINRANAAKTVDGNGNGKKASGSTQQPNEKKSVNTKSGAQQIQDQLAPAREAVADFTVKTVLGGVPLGLSRLASGEFGEAGEEVFGFIADFNGALRNITANTAFQLVAADDEDESKKMLSGGQDIATAATVVS